jgi:chromosome segregation ATPase
MIGPAAGLEGSIMADSTTILRIDPRAAVQKQVRPSATQTESRPDTRWLSYDEIMETTGLSRDATIRTVRRNRWAKREGNIAGELRFAVPTSVLAELRKAAAPLLDAAGEENTQASALHVLGTIQRKFDLLESREERLEGYLRQQMEREYKRADVAEATLLKTERRLEKYHQALETMQVAVAARKAAEAALAAAEQRLALVQSIAETERAQAAATIAAERSERDILTDEARKTAEQLSAMIRARDVAELALAEATRKQVSAAAEAMEERKQLEAALGQERDRSAAYLEQLRNANAAVHATAGQRIQSETALAAALEQLEQVKVGAAEERAEIEAIFAERIRAIETARKEVETDVAVLNQQLEATRSSSLAERAHVEAVLSERLQRVESARDEAQSAAVQALESLRATEAARADAEARLQVHADRVRLLEEETREAEAALADLQGQMEAARQCSLAERAQIEAGSEARLADVVQARDQAQVARAHLEAEVRVHVSNLAEIRLQVEAAHAQLAAQQADTAAALATGDQAAGALVKLEETLAEANARLDGVEAAALEERTQFELRLIDQRAELQLVETRVQDVASAATAANGQMVSALEALSHRAEAAEAELAAERKRCAALEADHRSRVEGAAAALAKSEARADRAVGQLEAERLRAKEAVERAVWAEANLSKLHSSPLRDLLTRIAAILKWKTASRSTVQGLPEHVKMEGLRIGIHSAESTGS